MIINVIKWEECSVTSGFMYILSETIIEPIVLPAPAPPTPVIVAPSTFRFMFGGTPANFFVVVMRDAVINSTKYVLTTN